MLGKTQWLRSFGAKGALRTTNGVICKEFEVSDYGSLADRLRRRSLQEAGTW